MTKLMSFAPILLATRSKFASEYSKKLIKVLLKKNVENFFNKMFLTKKKFLDIFLCFKSSEMYEKQFPSKSEQKQNYVRGASPPGPGYF